ncbi:hypothetical protein [Paenibacillus lutimineralis]|uniref:hypothetical protein n=1 Tax=Paenibacillus lutimineralis TaxID=2707005 RepID=UPI0013A652D8|nr:hypothetical protein [Paenibacillus lutimineralis]
MRHPAPTPESTFDKQTNNRVQFFRTRNAKYDNEYRIPYPVVFFHRAFAVEESACESSSIKKQAPLPFRLTLLPANGAVAIRIKAVASGQSIL